MQTAGAVVSSSVHTNGNGRIKVAKITKRNGLEVAYDKAKIVQAIQACFINSCGWADNAETRARAEKIATQVDHLLIYQKQPISVERVQDLVEQQLMADGLYDQAKEYILYREKRRQSREAAEVPAEVTAAFQESASYFTGANKHAQIFQSLDKFARFNYEKGRRETWPETVDRVIQYTRKHLLSIPEGKNALSTLTELHQSLLTLEVAPSMRLIQMAGPALERCQSGVYNCSFQFIQSPQDLAEEMYLLCQGCGVGFSVEYQYAVDKWPRVKKQRGGKPTQFTVPDTTEGWCDALKTGVEHWLDGRDIVFDYSLIRPEGAILKTKGGRASGYRPLKECLDFTRARFLAKAGGRLSSIDLHDIVCFIHRISGVGGVRRASGISLSDLDDMDMRHSKTGNFWSENPQRNQANNSAVYEERPAALDFMDEWMALARSGSGERGIFNRGSLKKQFPKRRVTSRQLFGTNPCGEIVLRHKQFCNLSIAVARTDDPLQELMRKVRLAAIWGTIQSTMTRFNYVSPEWKKNCEEERLLGVDILGHFDHPLLRPGAPRLEQTLQTLRDLAVATNAEWAARLGINPSAAVTCGKPGGDSSVFFDAAPGFKAWHGQYFVRRCRGTSDNPVIRMLKDQGVPCHADYDRSGTMVVEFPCRAPEGAKVLGGQSAIEQLEHWKIFKQNYCEHNPSVTIYVKDHEWLAVGHWVYENWDVVGGLSFYPFDDAVYPLAPYEAISKEEYEARLAAFPNIDWGKLVRYETEDMTIASQTMACTGGACAT